MMKTNYLLPYRLKIIGWLLLVPSLVLGIIHLITDQEPEFLDTRVFAVFINEAFGEQQMFGIIENNIYNEIIGIMIIVGSVFVGFSREKQEDELISSLRLESLLWATYINYAILVLAFLFVYDLSFFLVLVLNMFTILLLFIINFNWRIWKFKKTEES